MKIYVAGNFMRKFFNVFILVILSTCVFGEIKTIVPGITFEQILTKSPAKQLVNIVKIDLNNPDISVSATLADKNTMVSGKLTGKQPVSTITKNNNAIVGINADYFIMESFRDPLNLCIVNGQLVSEPEYSRSVIAFDENKKVYFDVPVWDSKIFFSNGNTYSLSGVNRYRNQGEFILYTNDWGNTTKSKYVACDILLRPDNGNNSIKIGENKKFFVEAIFENSINPAIPDGKFVLSGGGKQAELLKNNINVGDSLNINFNLKSAHSVPWENIRSAVGGGPMLVKNGKVSVTGVFEKFDSFIVNTPNPRSGVGLSQDEKTLIIVSLDGRQNHSVGLSLNDFAKVMINAGAYTAMNLDGGGSTALSIAGLIVNSPSGISERSVANAILIYSKYIGNNDAQDLGIDIAGNVYRTGNTYDLHIPEEIDKSRFIWATRGGIGYVLQDNTLWTAKSRAKGTLGFIYDGKPYSYSIEISDAPLKNISVINEYYDDNKTVSKITAFMLDSNKKPVIFTPAFINIKGGFTEKNKLVTNNGGNINFDVIWDVNSPVRIVNVYLGNISGFIDLSSDFNATLETVEEVSLTN